MLVGGAGCRVAVGLGCTVAVGSGVALGDGVDVANGCVAVGEGMWVGDVIGVDVDVGVADGVDVGITCEVAVGGTDSGDKGTTHPAASPTVASMPTLIKVRRDDFRFLNSPTLQFPNFPTSQSTILMP